MRLGHPRRLARPSRRLVLTGVTGGLSVRGVACHPLARAHHAGAHAWVLPGAAALVLTGLAWGLSVLGEPHALSGAPGARAHARMLAHGHTHSDIVH